MTGRKSFVVLWFICVALFVWLLIETGGGKTAGPVKPEKSVTAPTLTVAEYCKTLSKEELLKEIGRRIKK